MKIELDTDSNDPATQDALIAYATIKQLMGRHTEAQDILMAIGPERLIAAVYINDDEGKPEEFGPFSQDALDIFSSHLIAEGQDYCVVTAS